MDNRSINYTRLAGHLIGEELDIKEDMDVLIINDIFTDTRVAGAIAAQVDSKRADFIIVLVNGNNTKYMSKMLVNAIATADVVVCLSKKIKEHVFDISNTSCFIDYKDTEWLISWGNGKENITINCW